MKLKPKSEEKKPKSLFSRGYNPVKEKIGKGSKYTKSCYSCDYYYALEGEEELCQNNGVLRYDMIVTDRNIYCNQWKPTK